MPDYTKFFPRPDVTLYTDRTEETATGTPPDLVKQASYLNTFNFTVITLTIQVEIKTDNAANPAILRIRADGTATDLAVLQSNSLTFEFLEVIIDVSAFSSGRHTIEFLLEDGAGETATLRDTWIFGRE